VYFQSPSKIILTLK